MKKIGIMGAMPQEIDSIQAQMSNSVIRKIEGNTHYIEGNLNGAPVVLAFSGWGKVDAAITATTLISEFGAEAIIFTGVAGAASSKLNIGDLVIGESLYQHDFDASPLFDQHVIPSTKAKFAASHKTLVTLAAQSAAELFSDFQTIIGAQHAREFNIVAPKFETGIIASGDQFICRTEQTERINQATANVLAVEMEGAAIAHTCDRKSIPCIVLRTISDKADHTAHIDFPNFVENIARRYSGRLIPRLIELVHQNQKDIFVDRTVATGSPRAFETATIAANQKKPDIDVIVSSDI